MGSVIGGVTGALGGILGGKKEGGTSTDNMYLGNVKGLQSWDLQEKLNKGIEGNLNFRQPDYASELNSNPIYSQLYGDKGALGRALSEEQDLAKSGYEFTPQDRDAYAQASGDIARQSDQRESGLAQALAARGLSSSGAAGMAFAGSQGNKYEQLAKLQSSLAKDRYDQNMKRLSDTRNFAMQLGQGGQQSLNDMFNRSAETQNMHSKGASMAQDYLDRMQGQQNKSFEQQQATAKPSATGQALLGAAGGALAGSGLSMPSLGGLFGNSGGSGRNLAAQDDANFYLGGKK